MNTIKPVLNKLLILSLFAWCISCSNQKKSKHLNSLKQNIGDTFSLAHLMDTSGEQVQLDFTKHNITIIDFWINECPPCNEEMMQFKNVLKGKENKVQIISVSLSSYLSWKKLFTERTNRYAFLDCSIPNWQHLVAKSYSSVKGNVHSFDRIEEVGKSLNVTYFPSFFVLDKNGIITARPVSAVEYINDEL